MVEHSATNEIERKRITLGLKQLDVVEINFKNGNDKSMNINSVKSAMAFDFKSHLSLFKGLKEALEIVVLEEQPAGK